MKNSNEIVQADDIPIIPNKETIWQETDIFPVDLYTSMSDFQTFDLSCLKYISYLKRYFRDG